MPKQYKEYIAWQAVRHGCVGLFFVYKASFLEDDKYASQLFAIVPLWLWVLWMFAVVFVALWAIAISNLVWARISFALSMGVTLALALTFIMIGAFDNISAPFLTLFLIVFVGKDFAMTRLPVLDTTKIDRQE